MILYQQDNSSIPYNYNVFDYENFNYPPHLHRDLELVCVLEGELIACIEGRDERLQQGEFALILPNQAHAFQTPQTSLVRVMVFSEEYVREFHKTLGKREGQTSGFAMPDPERELFLERLNTAQPHRLELCAFLMLACEEWLKAKEQEGLVTADGQKGELMHRILQYISAHYTENLTLVCAAEALGYEPHYFSRCFHRLFGKNFKSFVNEYRVDHARQLLSDPYNHSSLTEIALASGFQSVRNFNRSYRELTGCEPRRTRVRE